MDEVLGEECVPSTKKHISGLPGQENVRCQRRVGQHYSAQSESKGGSEGVGEGVTHLFLKSELKGGVGGSRGVRSDVFRQARQENVNRGEGSAQLTTAQAG